MLCQVERFMHISDVSVSRWDGKKQMPSDIWNIIQCRTNTGDPSIRMMEWALKKRLWRGQTKGPGRVFNRDLWFHRCEKYKKRDMIKTDDAALLSSAWLNAGWPFAKPGNKLNLLLLLSFGFWEKDVKSNPWMMIWTQQWNNGEISLVISTNLIALRTVWWSDENISSIKSKEISLLFSGLEMKEVDSIVRWVHKENWDISPAPFIAVALLFFHERNLLLWSNNYFINSRWQR